MGPCTRRRCSASRESDHQEDDDRGGDEEHRDDDPAAGADIELAPVGRAGWLGHSRTYVRVDFKCGVKTDRGRNPSLRSLQRRQWRRAHR